MITQEQITPSAPRRVFSIVSVFPELHHKFLKTSLIAKAQNEGIVEFNLVALSDMCEPKKRIDEPVCGPGAGMIIKPEIIETAIEHCEQEYGKAYKIFFSPQGKTLTQNLLKQFSEQLSPTSDASEKVGGEKILHILLVCSRYEGIDERVEEFYADTIISIGDYVLLGGDIPAQVFIEGLLRLIPDVVGKQESVEQESFSGPFLDYPEYGLPKTWKNKPIPEIVLSGDHKKIEQWRQEAAAKKTALHRFDWFRKNRPSSEQIEIFRKQIPNHYVALMHADIVIKGGRIGYSSVTSLDLHDIARSSATYGIKKTFMVSPLKDQQAIMKSLLDFWKSESGEKYNLSRHQAVSRVETTKTLADTVDHIAKDEEKKPLIITTSAKTHEHTQKIDFSSQGRVWSENRPILFVFGTAQGLSEEVLNKSDFLLVPVNGMTNYNHLSVRSAVAIILDRWLGLQ